MRNTREVARILKVAPNALHQAIYAGKLSAPKQRAGGYLWNLDEIAAASWAVRRREHFIRWLKDNSNE